MFKWWHFGEKKLETGRVVTFVLKQLNIFEQYFLVGKIRNISKELLGDMAEDTGNQALELALIVGRNMRLKKKMTWRF